MTTKTIMTLAEITPELTVAIHQEIVLDGSLPKDVAQRYGLSIDDLRTVFRKACEDNEARRGSNAASWRYELLNIRLFDAAQLQQAFERSTRSKKTIKRRMVDGKFVPAEQIIEERCGDPRYLSTKSAVLDAIAKLTGAEVPKEVNVNTKSQHDITFRLESMSDEELHELATIARLEQQGIIQIDAKDVREVQNMAVKQEAITQEPQKSLPLAERTA